MMTIRAMSFKCGRVYKYIVACNLRIIMSFIMHVMPMFLCLLIDERHVETMLHVETILHEEYRIMEGHYSWYPLR